MDLIGKIFRRQTRKLEYDDGREYLYIEQTNQLLPANYLAAKFECERAGTNGAIFKTGIANENKDNIKMGAKIY